MYFGSVPSGLTIEILYIFLCGMRSGGGRLLVCFCSRPRRGEMFYEGIFPQYFICFIEEVLSWNNWLFSAVMPKDF